MTDGMGERSRTMAAVRGTRPQILKESKNVFRAPGAQEKAARRRLSHRLVWRALHAKPRKLDGSSRIHRTSNQRSDKDAIARP